MLTRTQASIAYLVFLTGFAAFKYLGAAPSGFDSQYAISVAILVVLTGVLPYVLACWTARRAAGRRARWVAALAVAIIACCAGYAAYWTIAIRPQGLGIPMTAVALRGLIAGPIEGVLAAFWVTARK